MNAATGSKLRVLSAEGRSYALGGDPSEFDRGVVIDPSLTEKHPITGAAQSIPIFRGTLAECHAFVRQRMSQHCAVTNDHANCPRENTLGTSACVCTCHAK